MTQTNTIGLDLAKQVFQVHGADAEGAPLFNRRLRRAEVLRSFEKQPTCLVGLEACGGAHYWAREIAALGHDVRLIPPAYVNPFVKRGLLARRPFKVAAIALANKIGLMPKVAFERQQGAAE